MNRSREAVIAGIGQTTYRRRHQRSLGALIGEATRAALGDAGLEAAQIDTVLTEGSTSPISFPIDRFATTFGFSNLRHHGYFGTGGSGLFYAVLQAAMLIRQGMSSGAVVYFGLDWGSQPAGPYAYHTKFPAKQLWEAPCGFFGQPVYFAAMARRYQLAFDLDEQAMVEGFADFALACRHNATRNPTSQMTTALDREAYLRSRPIADPLRLYDCCLVSDGAGCLVMLPAERCAGRGVRLLGGAYREESVDEEGFFSQSRGYLAMMAARAASRAAFDSAGVSLADDVDFVNVYDCFTISALLQLEAIGWCPPGQAIAACRDGATRTAGTRPVNTHGGLLSNGYLLGFNHLLEAVRQLRGEAGEGQVADAEVGVVTASPSRHHTTLVLGAA